MLVLPEVSSAMFFSCLCSLSPAIVFSPRHTQGRNGAQDWHRPHKCSTTELHPQPRSHDNFICSKNFVPIAPQYPALPLKQARSYYLLKTKALFPLFLSVYEAGMLTDKLNPLCPIASWPQRALPGCARSSCPAALALVPWGQGIFPHPIDVSL